jgi:hypothetical protein
MDITSLAKKNESMPATRRNTTNEDLVLSEPSPTLDCTIVLGYATITWASMKKMLDRLINPPLTDLL